jgi:hypothetical protein
MDFGIKGGGMLVGTWVNGAEVEVLKVSAIGDSE